MRAFSAFAASASRARVSRIARHRLVHPLNQFGRIEPAVAQFDQASGRVGDGDGVRIVCIARRRDVVRQVGRVGEGLEGGGRRVARIVALAEPRSELERPRLVKPAVQDAEGCIVVARDHDQLMVRANARVQPCERAVLGDGRCGDQTRQSQHIADFVTLAPAVGVTTVTGIPIRRSSGSLGLDPWDLWLTV